MRTHKIIGILAVTASLSLIAFQATKNESTVTFFTPEEVYANPAQFQNKRFRVSGLVLQNSKVWDASSKTLTFEMSDLKNHSFLVTYKGVPPDLFKERQGVVVEGEISPLFDKSKFHISGENIPLHLKANLLMVKHSEVYNTEGDHSKMREIRLKESLFNDVKK